MKVIVLVSPPFDLVYGRIDLCCCLKTWNE